MTQTRTENIPLFLIFEVQEHAISSMNLSSIEISITSLLLEYTAFFAFGGSNAISSVDLSSAYNGISGYNVIAVGALTFISNWAGSIWWVSARHLLLRGKPGAREYGYNLDLQLSTLFIVTSLLSVMVACTVLRTHLFIWTVFSPKFLYSMAWSTAHHLLINVVFGKLLLLAGVTR
jgi:ethanolaminephosphotransferase